MVTEIELFEPTDLTKVRFLFVAFDEERSLQKKSGYTRRIAFSMLLPALKKSEDEQNAIFAHDLDSEMSLTEGFANVYCERLQMCHLNITLQLK